VTVIDLKGECERALTLAQTITQDAVARIAEENPERGPQNATATAVFGYLVGVGESMIGQAIFAGCPLQYVTLFNHAKALGAAIGASNVDIHEIMKEVP
jgi:hypothetical protein